MPKKTFLMLIALVLIVIALVIAATFYWSRNHVSNNNISNNNPASSAVSHQFIGQISKIEGNTLSVSGTFVVAGHPELSGPGSSTKSVAVTLDANTKFQKTVLHLPNTTGTFSPSDLKKEVILVSASDFETDLTKNKVGITVLSDTNIYNSSAFTASEIDYIMPESVPLTPTNK